MKKFHSFIYRTHLLLLGLTLAPLVVRETQIFKETMSVQVDYIPAGSMVHLERFNGCWWDEFMTIDSGESPTLVFCFPLDDLREFRGYFTIEE